MKIGIDISQLQYKNTGVANYLLNLVTCMVEKDSKNSYVLFFSSLRGQLPIEITKLLEKYSDRTRLVRMPLPQTFLDIIWNQLHIIPIESFIGDVDIFISSDWCEPPTRHAKKGTILYDLITYKYPEETDNKIIATQKRKLQWVKKESKFILCISESTKKDAIELLGSDNNKLYVIHAGV